MHEICTSLTSNTNDYFLAMSCPEEGSSCTNTEITPEELHSTQKQGRTFEKVLKDGAPLEEFLKERVPLENSPSSPTSMSHLPRTTSITTTMLSTAESISRSWGYVERVVDIGGGSDVDRNREKVLSPWWSRCCHLRKPYKGG